MRPRFTVYCRARYDLLFHFAGGAGMVKLAAQQQKHHQQHHGLENMMLHLSPRYLHISITGFIYAAGIFLFNYTAIYAALGLHWQHVATVTIFEAQACFFSTLVSSCAECSMSSLLQSLRTAFAVPQCRMSKSVPEQPAELDIVFFRKCKDHSKYESYLQD